MTDVARKRYVRVGSLALLLVLILLRVVACGPTHPSAIADIRGDGRSGAHSGDASFSIEGNAVKAITPGIMVAVDLTFTNPHNVPISVSRLVVSVHLVNAPHANDARPCSGDDFALGQVSRSFEVTLAARSSSTLSSLDLDRKTWPHIGMLNRSVNQDGCKGASLTLDYTASGRVVGK